LLLLTALLYVPIAARLLRRQYAANFWQSTYYYVNDCLMKNEALLSHNTGPGSCCLLLLTALLYVLIAVRLLRRHYAGIF
jgi:hypothetical protein